MVQCYELTFQTHHVSLAAPVADFLVALNHDGSVRSAGPVEDADLSDEERDEEKLEKTLEAKKETGPLAEKAEKKKVPTKLFQAEEKSEGRISRRALFSFFGYVLLLQHQGGSDQLSYFGGPVFWLLTFGLLIGGQAFSSFQTYWLGRWARAYDEAAKPEDVSIAYYLGLYVAWIVISVVLSTASSVLYYIGSIKASRVIHKKLVDFIFGAYMRFLDITPVGRIISRFTKDIKNVDGSFVQTFQSVADITIGLVIKFAVVVSLVPLFSIPAVFIGVLGGVLGELYIHGQLSVKVCSSPNVNA